MSDMGEWIIFLTFDNVFVVKEEDISGCKGNCIVFPKNMFSLHSRKFCEDYQLFEGASKYTEVGVYYIREDHCRLAASEPRFSELFWPPPSWLSPESESSTGGSEDDEELDFSIYSGLLYSSDEEESLVSSQNIEETQEAQTHSPPRSQGDASQQEMPDENNTVSVLVNSSYEAPENADLLDALFEGLKVDSELIPVLHKVWTKHGNIAQDHVVRSNGLLTWALESLAKMIVILESHTGTSLDESQAEYLNSTLVDLQSMQFRLDWLVPYVERALVLHGNKEHLNAVVELESTRSKLLAELHEADRRIADQKKLVGESLEASAPLVLEDSLGEGLI